MPGAARPRGVGRAFADAGSWRIVFWVFAVQGAIVAAAARVMLPATDAGTATTGIAWRQLSCIAIGIALKPAVEALAGKVPKRVREFGMAERVDQVGDVAAKEADEDGALVLCIDRLAFVDRVTAPATV